MLSIYKKTHILFLGAYVASLLFSSIKVSTETSLSFILGVIWGISKLSSLLFHDRVLKTGIEGILIAVLYLYLAGVDVLVHGGSVIKPYYISFGLNCIMFLLLVDEFNKHPWMHEKTIQVFSITAIFVAIAYSAGMFVTQSQSGRLVFMHQNENELAVNFLIAFIFITVIVVRSAPVKRLAWLLVYTSAMLLLNALTYTGTRFAIATVTVTLSFLLVIAFKTSGRQRVSLFASFCLMFLAAKVLTFVPTFQRLSSDVPGNNLEDLGGRVPLWQDAMAALAQNPVSGLGYDGFQYFVLGNEKYFGMPHNFALEVGVLGGGIGLMLLLVLLCCMLRRIYNHWVCSRSFDAFIWFVPVFMTSMMLNITHMKAFWFLAAYFVALASSTWKNTTGESIKRHVY